MLPVLFSIANISISSFGVFLALSFLFGIFLVWRLARAWDLDEEKILDLTLLTFLGGLFLARLYFGVENWQFFSSNPLRLILVTQYPGFSFWGGFLGGWLTLYFLVRRSGGDFWQLADIAAVGFLGGLILSDIGCFLGGCSIGVQSNLFFAVPMVGAIGKRMPVQLIEALALSFVLVKIWSWATHFHLRGMIASLSLIYIGLIKFATEPLRQVHSLGFLFSLTLVVLGLTIFYKINAPRRTPRSDLVRLGSFLVRIVTDRQTQKSLIVALGKSWYNQKTALIWQVRSLSKLLRRMRVKPSPKNPTNY